MTIPLILLGGIASLDRFLALHMLLSRPFVISIIVGLLTSNLTYTFYVGLLIEFYGIIDVQVGTRLTREDTFLAYVLSLLVGLGYITDTFMFLLILLIFLIIMYPVGYTEVFVRDLNKFFLKRTKLTSSKIILIGSLMGIVRGIILYPLGFFIGVEIVSYFQNHVHWGGNFKFYSVFLTILLSGYVLRLLVVKSSYKYILFLIGLFLGWLIV
ncbi:MAG: hypothetical protein K6348_07405 [Deferribacterales bacterium]